VIDLHVNLGDLLVSGALGAAGWYFRRLVHRWDCINARVRRLEEGAVRHWHDWTPADC
jgi:hypothetical protein